METHKKITVTGVLSEGIGLGIKNAVLGTLVSDDKSAALVSTIRRLMAKDAKGSLRANKVLELKQLASKVNDDLLNEGIKIIEDAYKPVPSCQFITLEARDDDDEGKMKNVPLSISAM